MDSRTADDERLGGLMQAAQLGDADAYLHLLQDVTPRVRRMIARRGRGSTVADVEDLVQDVLLSLHVARASYDPGRPFLPWLLAIVRNRLADSARRYARKAAYELQVADLDVTFSESPANIRSRSDDGPALREAIAALSPGQRDAIELLKLRELSLKEAAQKTGLSIGALKVATHRAMTTLRRKLTGRNVHGH
jgi:RNA polymerase sigma-70 factor (ECF subfamily)